MTSSPTSRSEHVDDEVRADRARTASSPSPWTSAVAALCVYEVCAEALNVALDVDVLPTVSGGLRRFTVRSVSQTLAPRPWMRTAGTMGAGFPVYVLGQRRLRRRSA
jgi:hypothetical protein